MTASVVLANIALWLQAPFAALGGQLGAFGSLIALACFGLVGLVVYGGALVGGGKALGVDPAQLGLAKVGRLFRLEMRAAVISIPKKTQRAPVPTGSWFPSWP